TVPGHFNAVIRRADRLGSRGRVIDADLHQSGNAVLHLQYACIGVGGTAGVDAVEGFTRAPVPEEAEVVHRIDYRGRLTTGDLPHVVAVESEHGIRNGRAQVRQETGSQHVSETDKVRLRDARRTDHPAVLDREVGSRQERVGDEVRNSVRIE